MSAALQVTLEGGLLLGDQLTLEDRLLAVGAADGPDRLPLCTPESRKGGEWVAGSQSPCAVGMSSTRHESSRRYDARVSSSELHIGR